MALLRSFLGGAWVPPTGEGQPVFDAVTGEEVARVSSDGLDLEAALAYGRREGGPALRALTFHQRAALLKAVGGHLREHREELYELSARTGATLADSRFDVDGGIGVLLGYASRAVRELPNDTLLVEGDVEPLGRDGSFVAQHVLTSRQGVAVQINAFNFPVWGPLEKLAPAFLAGVPTLVKPASVTAYLTARLVELIAESDLLPPGSLQLLCGDPRDLLDHLTEQDSVAFTGIRGHRPPGPGPPHDRGPVGPLQRRGRLPQLLDPRARRRARHARVRAVRGPARHRDDGEGGAEVHRDPPGARARLAGRRRRRGGARAARRRGGRLAGRRAGHDGRPRQRGAARGGPARGQGAHRRGVARLRRPGQRGGGRRGCRARRVRLADAPPLRRRGTGRAARGRGVRARQHDHRVRLRRRGRRAGGAWARQPGGLRRDRRPRLRPAGRRRRVPVARSPPRPRPRLRDRLDRPRLTAAGPRARRPRPGRWGRGARWDAGRAAPPAAHRRAGQPGHAHRGHRPLGARLRPVQRRGAPVPQAARGPPHRRHGRGRPPHRHPRGHRTVRRAHRRHLLRPHGRRRRPGQPVLRAGGWRTATSSCPSPPACSSIPIPARCWPTTGSSTSASSRPSTRATSCRSRSPASRSRRGRAARTARSAGTRTSRTPTGESVATYDVLTLVAKHWPPVEA